MKNYVDNKCTYGYITLCDRCRSLIRHTLPRSWDHVDTSISVTGFPEVRCERCGKVDKKRGGSMRENYATELALLRRMCELVECEHEFHAFRTEDGLFLETGSFVDADLGFIMFLLKHRVPFYVKYRGEQVQLAGHRIEESYFAYTNTLK